jgi:hypothetical protein
MKNFNDSIADSLTVLSGTGAFIHYVTIWQPVISAVAGLIAIVSGALAALYYIKKLWF